MRQHFVACHTRTLSHIQTYEYAKVTNATQETQHIPSSKDLLPVGRHRGLRTHNESQLPFQVN